METNCLRQQTRSAGTGFEGSGGRIGSQLELLPQDLAKAARAEFAEIIRK